VTESYADLVLLSGRVLTLDSMGVVEGGVALRGATILAVGTDDQLQALVGPRTQVVQLDGLTVMPGLVDSHCHFEDAGIDRDTVSFVGVSTIAEALDRVRATASEHPAESWVRGRVWNPFLQLDEHRAPTREELDVAAEGRPVFLPLGHSAAVSSAALRAAGISDSPRDPDGFVEVDETGRPTGLLVEDGVHLVARVVPPWSEDQRRRQLVDAMAELNTWGITSVVGGAMVPADLDLLRELADSGRCTLRVSAMVVPTGETNPSVDLARWEELVSAPPRTGSPGAWVAERGIKLQIDGGMTLGTAATRAAYTSRPDYAGDVLVERERLAALVGHAHRHGWPVGVHVVGDAAIDLALDVFEETAGDRDPESLADVLIHASLIQPDQAQRAKELGVLVAAQTPFLWSNAEVIRGHLGSGRLESAVPLRDLIDILGAGAVAAGTDYPINPLDPFQNVFAMTSRLDRHGRTVGAAQAISRPEALHLYTTSGAAHTGELSVKGSLAAGKLADLVVLDTDPLTVAESELAATRAVMTVVGGRVVFDPHRLLSELATTSPSEGPS
jgi:predicted amidohydrolase YtcJ